MNIFNKIQKVVPEEANSDFVPFSCFVDKKTILLKNGEVAQIIKIPGFSTERNNYFLRDRVRQAILNNINSSKFSIWFSTIRGVSDLSLTDDYKYKFVKELNRSYNEEHNWDKQYVNDLYITIIRESKFVNELGLMKAFTLGLSPSFLYKKHDNLVKELIKDLDNVVKNISHELSSYNSKILSMKDEGGIYYSEQMELFNKILYHDSKKVKVDNINLSDVLTDVKSFFGFNIYEISKKKNKSYGAILYIKEYQKRDAKILDKILQSPMELLISQSVSFVSKKKGMQEYLPQLNALKLSSDKKLAEDSKLKEMVSYDRDSKIPFAETHITIRLNAESISKLEKNIQKLNYIFNDLGLIVARQDIRLEDSYWAQLPGNFSHIPYFQYVPSKLIAGFAALTSYPTGKRSGNKWLNALTLFNTSNNMPYFFNFHEGLKGHTSIIGPKRSGRDVLTNFLISCSRKYNGKLFVFGDGSVSKLLVNAMNGTYGHIVPNKNDELLKYEKYGFNPLSIDDSENNRIFLERLIIYLAKIAKCKITDDIKEVIHKAIEYNFTLEKDNRQLRNISKVFEENKKLSDAMKLWHGDGNYAHLFDNHSSKSFKSYKDVFGFDLSRIMENKELLMPVMWYLLYWIESELDGSPTIIALNDVWKKMPPNLFFPDIEKWLERIEKKNAVVIFSSHSALEASQSELSECVAKNVATSIFLPNRNLVKKELHLLQKIWGITDEQLNKYNNLRITRGQFLIKKQSYDVIAELDLRNIKEYAILNPSQKSIEIYNKIVSNHGHDGWLERFYEDIL